MKMKNISLLIACLGIAAPCAADTSCKQTVTVQTAIVNAKKLDGKLVCIKGRLRTIAESRGTSFSELIADRSSTYDRGSRAAIGIVEWSSDEGIHGATYKPESFKLLE